MLIVTFKQRGTKLFFISIIFYLSSKFYYSFINFLAFPFLLFLIFNKIAHAVSTKE